MPSKKLSFGWNTALVYLGGASILYALFRLLKKEKKQKTQDEVLQETPVASTPSPIIRQATYEDYFNWIRMLENVTYRAKRDGKDKSGNALYSIGMGHQIQPGEEYLLNKTITEDEVRALFKKDIEKVARDVESVVRVPLTKNQKIALVSIRYNTGSGGFRSGNLLSTLNSGNYAKTAILIPDFITTSDGGIFNPGLRNRRLKERNLFVNPN
jgi:lysozyme